MTLTEKILQNKTVLIYGLSLAVLLLLLRWLELRFIIFDHSMEIYTGAIAVIFTALGIWLALQLTKPKVETVYVEKEVLLEKEVFIEKEVYINNAPVIKINETEISNLGISKRELEVLQLMASGMSNSEIAEHLFVSLNTVKTHSSKLFEKMDVKRRTQAVEKAKKLHLIP
nr:DNA-binding response regulator [Bacteroidota bacterium]